MFKPQTLSRLLIPFINDRQEIYGEDVSLGLLDPAVPDLGRKRLLIEFSSPNVTGEFQGKHLRSTILGAYIGNLYEAMGWGVIRMNYLGDWGKPIGLLGVGWEKFGSEGLFQANPSGHLLDLYDQINEQFNPEQIASRKARDKGGDTADIEAHGLFAERNAYCRRLEEGEQTAIAFWQRVRKVVIDNYSTFYAHLNVKFDDYSGESQVDPKTMNEVEEILKRKGLVKESGGAWTIDLKKHAKKAGTAIIRDRTGSSTYLLRDLAAVLERERKYSFDKMIYVVAADQHTVHFSRLIKILELMDMKDLADKLQHVSFSDAAQTPKNALQRHELEEILSRYQLAMQDSLHSNVNKAGLLNEKEGGARDLAVSALLTQELATRRANDHAIDISHATSFDPGTGADLQYWYARVCSLLEAACNRASATDEELSSLVEEEQTNLLRILVQYPDVTHAAHKSLESAPLVAYLFTVTGQLSLCFDGTSVATATSAQLMLCEAVRIVLENGMKLLGITPVVKHLHM